MAGVLHPWSGVDHIAAMLAAGAAFSAIVLRILGAATTRERVAIAALLVITFCLFQGYVHALETPGLFAQSGFTGGFALSTIALQLLGAALGTSLWKWAQRDERRAHPSH
jgi:hydrogenase/urease accessory protein HupE